MTCDRVLEPVVAAGRVFMSINDCDQLAAYDAKTGVELWTCFTSRPGAAAARRLEGARSPE